jgi:hypothetical protein
LGDEGYQSVEGVGERDNQPVPIPTGADDNPSV